MNKIQLLTMSLASCFAISSCTTTYDATGRPVQSVDPGAAAVGIVAAGLIGAAVASNNNRKHDSRHYNSHSGYRSDRRHYSSYNSNNYYSSRPSRYHSNPHGQVCYPTNGRRYYY